MCYTCNGIVFLIVPNTGEQIQKLHVIKKKIPAVYEL